MNNSVYTSAAATTALEDAVKAAQVVGQPADANWTTVANGLTETMPFDSNLNIYDEYDGDNGVQVKQADVVMLTYPINFPMASGVGLNDLNYYAPRTDLQGCTSPTRRAITSTDRPKRPCGHGRRRLPHADGKHAPRTCLPRKGGPPGV